MAAQLNEGYAEYIANIPIEKNAFQTSRERIGEGVIESFILDYERRTAERSGKIPKLGAAERAKYLKEQIPSLPPVLSVLGVTDKVWHATPTAGGYSEMAGRYRTAHLIIYYFLHLDGEDGVSKLCRYVARKRQMAADFADYRAAFAEYERKFEEFMKLPGVERLDDGRFKYPQNLTPPRAPESPMGEGTDIDSSGIEILFDGEAPEALARRIEDALRADLGLPLKFNMRMTPPR